MKKMIGIVGTNSDNSTNRQLLKFVQKHFNGIVEIELVEIKDLPLFDKPEDKQLPAIVMQLSEKVEAADAVIISTPEYDHAIPAALMNALNWLSYATHPFVDKSVMIMGASYGTLGSSRAQQHLRRMLDAPELMARIMPSSEFLLSHSLEAFDEQGNLKEPTQVEKLDGLFKDFLTFTDITEKLQNAYTMKKSEAENFSWENL